MSEFKKAVLRVVNFIPKGKVASYGQVALLAGVPRGARQVGNILCQYGEGNTPWWRVINNAGRITTTCLDHTALIQKKTLESEGVKVSKNLKIEIDKYRWLPDESIVKSLELEEKYLDDLMTKYF